MKGSISHYDMRSVLFGDHSKYHIGLFHGKPKPKETKQKSN